MAEQEKQKQTSRAGDEASAEGEAAANTGSSNQTARVSKADDESQGSNAEQTGEGTGAKAGEYS